MVMPDPIKDIESIVESEKFMPVLRHTAIFHLNRFLRNIQRKLKVS